MELDWKGLMRDKFRTLTKSTIGSLLTRNLAHILRNLYSLRPWETKQCNNARNKVVKRKSL